MPSRRRTATPRVEALEGRALLATAWHPRPAWGLAAHVRRAAAVQVGGPTITAARMTPAGIAITFSAPMDPARVTAVSNYRVQDITFRSPGVGDLVGLFLMGLGGGGGTTANRAVRLQAATYDPASRTVTLVPVQPLQASDTYFVSGRTRPGPGRHGQGPEPLTDYAGRPLVPGAGPAEVAFTRNSFRVTVQAAQGK